MVAQRAIFAATASSAERTVYEGVGEGGDHTLVIDRECEDVVFAELEQLAAQGASFVAVSEERGEVSFGDGGEVRVVIDPIDGSLNARRTIPSHSLSIAVASGPSMADVEFGFVHDFGADEEFSASRGARRQARRPRRPRSPPPARSSRWSAWSRPSRSGPCRALAALEGEVYRLRVVGSIAITAAYVAAGRFDAMLSLRPCRSVDVAAAQLIVREAGGEVGFADLELSEAALDLDARFPIAAGHDAAALATVLRRPGRRRPRVTTSGKRFKNTCSQRTYVRYTRGLSRTLNKIRRDPTFMAQSKNGTAKSKTQAKRATTEAKKSAAATAKATKRAATKTAVAEKNQVQTVAETAVDFPVGVVLSVSDRVSDLVEPWTGRTSAEKQIKAYRTQLRKSLKRTERRGSTARRKATTEARKTRNRVEREARKHQRTSRRRSSATATTPSSASARRSTSRPPAPRVWSIRSPIRLRPLR